MRFYGKSPLTYVLRENREPIAGQLFSFFEISWQAELSIAVIGNGRKQWIKSGLPSCNATVMAFRRIQRLWARGDQSACPLRRDPSAPEGQEHDLAGHGRCGPALQDRQFRGKSVGQYAYVDAGDAVSVRAGSAASFPPHGPKGFLRPHEPMGIYRYLARTFPYFFRTIQTQVIVSH
jgi:hypothetical protein